MPAAGEEMSWAEENLGLSDGEYAIAAVLCQASPRQKGSAVPGRREKALQVEGELESSKFVLYSSENILLESSTHCPGIDVRRC